MVFDNLGDWAFRLVAVAPFLFLFNFIRATRYKLCFPDQQRALRSKPTEIKVLIALVMVLQQRPNKFCKCRNDGNALPFLPRKESIAA